jgi:L-threonylcarbamoyladenylate synthase
MKVIAYGEILEESNISLIKDIVAADGVVVYPTDTLYGLGGDFFSLKVTETINRIKNRQDMPYSAAIHGPEMLHRLVADIPEIFYKLYDKLLPGKFTFLFKVSSHIAPALVKGSDKIGIRIPDAAPMLKLLRVLNVPFISTSVNRSGEPPLNDPQIIRRTFSAAPAGAGVSLLIDAGPLPLSAGSTILDLTQSPIKCLRKGDSFHRLKELDLVFSSE